MNRKLRSTMDADSTVVRHQNGKSTPSYKNHRALDDKPGVITAVKTTTGAVDEASELFELIERHERFTASKTVQDVTPDDFWRFPRIKDVTQPASALPQKCSSALVEALL